MVGVGILYPVLIYWANGGWLDYDMSFLHQSWARISMMIQVDLSDPTTPIRAQAPFTGAGELIGTLPLSIRERLTSPPPSSLLFHNLSWKLWGSNSFHAYRTSLHVQGKEMQLISPGDGIWLSPLSGFGSAAQSKLPVSAGGRTSGNMVFYY